MKQAVTGETVKAGRVAPTRGRGLKQVCWAPSSKRVRAAQRTPTGHAYAVRAPERENWGQYPVFQMHSLRTKYLKNMK